MKGYFSFILNSFNPVKKLFIYSKYSKSNLSFFHTIQHHCWVRKHDFSIYTPKKRSIHLFQEKIVENINKKIQTNPKTAILIFFSLDAASIFIIHALVSFCKIEVPAEWAMAFLFSRTLRRFRLPLELFFAKILCSYVPQLRLIKLSTAFIQIFPQKIRTDFTLNKTVKNGFQRIGEIVNSYGVGYFISSRWTGLFITSGFYTALSMGFNVQDFLKKYNLDQSGTVMASWALSVSISSLLFPFTITGGGLLWLKLSKIVKHLFNPKM